MNNKTQAHHVLQKMRGCFTQNTRHDGTKIWVCNKDDNTLVDMRAIHKAVDDRLPCDWVYETTVDAITTMLDYPDLELDELSDKVHEVSDGLVSVYNCELTAWLASHLYNIDLCNEACEEMGLGDVGLVERIQAGMYEGNRRIIDAVLSQLSGNLGRILEDTARFVEQEDDQS